MQPQNRFKRKQYIVAAKFQLRYVGLILMLVFLTGILCSYVVYYTSMLLLGDKLANVYPQGRLISILSTVNIRILLSLFLITPMVVVIGIWASHKIAGPIYRIEKYLGGMAAGDFSVPLTLRKNDELVSLADGINGMADTVKSGIRQEREALARASSSLENLRRAAQPEVVDRAALESAIDRFSVELGKMKSELDKYKV